MAKGKSRSARAGWAADGIRTIASELQDLIDDCGGDLDSLSKTKKATVVKEANKILSNVDFSEVESLTEEMTSWRDNMSGANMEHLPKYDEVSEACDELENIDTGVDTEVADVGDIGDAISQLEDIADALEGVCFPGMY
jgi:paraquat-inducible protein B